MREFNLLSKYPKSKSKRVVSEGLRTIESRIVASERGFDFFDGERNSGYGGFKYDGRWKPIVEDILANYNLTANSKVLHINSEKGFLLHDLSQALPGIEVVGTETSAYAISKTIDEVRDKIIFTEPTKLPFNDDYFDFVIGLGVIYTLNIVDAIKALREIIRVSKKCAFVTLASYEDEYDYFLFKRWTLLGTTILKKEEWIKILEYCEYGGDYFFTNSTVLELTT